MRERNTQRQTTQGDRVPPQHGPKKWWRGGLRSGRWHAKSKENGRESRRPAGTTRPRRRPRANTTRLTTAFRARGEWPRPLVGTAVCPGAVGIESNVCHAEGCRQRKEDFVWRGVGAILRQERVESQGTAGGAVGRGRVGSRGRRQLLAAAVTPSILPPAPPTATRNAHASDPRVAPAPPRPPRLRDQPNPAHTARPTPRVPLRGHVAGTRIPPPPPARAGWRGRSRPNRREVSSCRRPPRNAAHGVTRARNAGGREPPAVQAAWVPMRGGARGEGQHRRAWQNAVSRRGGGPAVLQCGPPHWVGMTSAVGYDGALTLDSPSPVARGGTWSTLPLCNPRHTPPSGRYRCRTPEKH